MGHFPESNICITDLIPCFLADRTSGRCLIQDGKTSLTQDGKIILSPWNLESKLKNIKLIATSFPNRKKYKLEKFIGFYAHLVDGDLEKVNLQIQEKRKWI